MPAKNEFSLTQEFAAMMLGASRPTVTVVASTLQKAGLIISTGASSYFFLAQGR